MNDHPIQPEAKSAPFIKQYWWLLLTVVILCIAVVWLLAWNGAARGASSLYWIYLHLDSATALTAFGLFIVISLAIVIGLLLRALFRRRAPFRWQGFLWGLFIGPVIFVIGGLSYVDYDSIQELASASLDGHTYQWLEFKDFMDPHYTLLDCDSVGVVCHSVYTYNLVIVCTLNDPRAQNVPTDSKPITPTLSTDSAARTITAQLNERIFFTYDIAAQHGVGPCGK